MDRQVAAQFRDEIVAAAGAAGVHLAYNRIRQLVVRAIREGHVRNVLRQLRLEGRLPRTASTLARGIGIERPVRESVEPKRLDFDMTDTAMKGNTVYDPNSGAYNQRKRVRDRTGDARSLVDRKLAILGSHMHTFIDRFQGVNPPIWNRTNTETAGHFPLQFRAMANLDYHYPVHTYDLTSAYQNRANLYNSTSEGTYRGVPGQSLSRFATVNYWTWQTINGTRSDGNTDDPRWIVERTPIALSAPQDTTYRVGDKGYIEWIDVRMMLYGSIKTPTTVTVQLVRLNKMCPRVEGYGNTAASLQTIEQWPQPDERPDFDEYQDLWLGFVDRLVGNPISKRGMNKPDMEVLYTKRFEFEPSMTTEEDKTPHAVEFNLKYSMDKVIDYVRAADAPEQIPNTDMDDAAFFVAEDQNKTSLTCDKRGRVFLLVTGQVPKDCTVLAEGEKLGDYCPSYDLILRRKHAFLHRAG